MLFSTRAKIILEALLHHPEGLICKEIRTLPIHHTQRELEPNVFELTLVPALDFDIYMRRYPGTTWKVVDAIVL